MLDLDSYRDAWHRRFAEEERQLKKRARAARLVASALAVMLREQFGAERVWLIGSLARATFDVHSDIDIVAEGLEPAQFFHVCACLQNAAGDFAIDLAPFEDLRPLARSALDREGVPL